MTLLVPALLASLSSGLTIETGSPDAHCPDLAMTQRAAEARLGILAVEGPAKWRAVYNIVHAPDKDGDRVRLELFDPKGDRKLERDLPLAGESHADDTCDITPTRSPQRLAQGRSRLTDGSVVHLSPASEASVSVRGSDRTTIDLAGGTVELQVAHQIAGRHVEVVSGVYRFVALGTQFRVRTASGRVDLEVTEGTVGVMVGAKRSATGTWCGLPIRTPKREGVSLAPPGVAERPFCSTARRAQRVTSTFRTAPTSSSPTN